MNETGFINYASEIYSKKKNFYVLVVVEDNWKIALFIGRCAKKAFKNRVNSKEFKEGL